MHFYTNNGFPETDRNDECFGWWLSDILSDPSKTQTPSIDTKNEEYDSGVYFDKTQFTSDESLTSGSNQDKSDLKSNVFGLEDSRSNSSLKSRYSHTQLTKNEEPASTTSRSRLRAQNSEIMMASVEKVSPLRDLVTNINPESHYYCSKLEPMLNESHTHGVLFDSEPSSSTCLLHRMKRSARSINWEDENEELRLKSYSKSAIIRPSSSVLLEKFVSSIEDESLEDQELEETRGNFLKAVSGLDSRLRTLETNTVQMQRDLDSLHNEFQMQENSVSRMTEDAHSLLSDLQNVRYLDDLIYLLQGQLDRITLRKWPFILAHVLPQNDSSLELNLVV